MSRAYPDIAEHLPVEITGFDVEGTVLTIWGLDWTLAILAPWEGTLDGRAIYSDDDDLADQFRSLVGEALLGVGAVGLDDTGFQFSNGVLFVPPHPTESAWRLRLPHDEFCGRPEAS